MRQSSRTWRNPFLVSSLDRYRLQELSWQKNSGMSDARLYESLSGRKDINAIRRALQTSALDTHRLAPHHHLKNTSLSSSHSYLLLQFQCRTHITSIHHNGTNQIRKPQHSKNLRARLPHLHRRNNHTQLVTAVETDGVFGLINHGISPEESEHMLSTSASFFSLSDSTKATVPFTTLNATWEKNAQIRPSTGQPNPKSPIRCNSGST